MMLELLGSFIFAFACKGILILLFRRGMDRRERFGGILLDAVLTAIRGYLLFSN
jgi:hypothetical protein